GVAFGVAAHHHLLLAQAFALDAVERQVGGAGAPLALAGALGRGPRAGGVRGDRLGLVGRRVRNIGDRRGFHAVPYSPIFRGNSEKRIFVRGVHTSAGKMCMARQSARLRGSEICREINHLPGKQETGGGRAGNKRRESAWKYIVIHVTSWL